MIYKKTYNLDIIIYVNNDIDKGLYHSFYILTTIN